MNIWIRATKEEEALELSNIQKAAFQPLYEQYHDEGNPCLRGVEDIANRLGSEFFRYFTIFLDEEIVGGVLYKCKGRTPFMNIWRKVTTTCKGFILSRNFSVRVLPKQLSFFARRSLRMPSASGWTSRKI